jgi:protein-S-isoprenylcysteine O-methyltransferase Ste14
MSLLARLRHLPWVAGLLLLVLALVVAAPVVAVAGSHRWPAFAGVAALALLAFGALERLWQRRPLPRRQRSVDRSRFRVVNGGKSKGKSNGHAQDLPGKGDDDKPRWVM